MFMTQRGKWASDQQTSLNGIEIVGQSSGLLRRRSMLSGQLRRRAGGKNCGGENALLPFPRGFFYFRLSALSENYSGFGMVGDAMLWEVA